MKKEFETCQTGHSHRYKLLNFQILNLDLFMTYEKTKVYVSLYSPL